MAVCCFGIVYELYDAMYVCAYTYIHTYIYIYTYVYIYIYIYILYTLVQTPLHLRTLNVSFKLSGSGGTT